MPSKGGACGPSPSRSSGAANATNAPAAISPVISPSKTHPGAVATEQSFEHEARCDVVGVALELHRLALALGGPRSQLRELGRARLRLARAERGQQRPVADDVGIPADRGGEVAVGAGVQAGVAEVHRGVVGLLERAQDQGPERDAPAPAVPRDVALDRDGDRAEQVRRLRRGHRVGHRRCRHLQRGELAHETLHAAGIGTLVDAIEARHLALREQPRDRLVGGDHEVLDHPVGLGLHLSVHGQGVAPLVELELGLGRVDRERPRGLAAALQRRRGLAGRLQRRGPRLGSALAAREDAVDPVVVQPFVRADQRAVKGCLHDVRAVELHLDRDRGPVQAGTKRAGVARERVREHRRDGARRVHARRALACLDVEP